MARTKRNAMNIAEARDKIRTTQLINRLENHVFGKVDMTPTQVTAALGLLKKSLPDLTATKHSGDPDNPIRHSVEDERESIRKQIATDLASANIGSGTELVSPSTDTRH